MSVDEAEKNISDAAASQASALDLGRLRLTEVPASIGDLTDLTELRIFGNELATLPAAVGNLTGLISLHLFDNRLAALPDSIGNLTELRELGLSKNELSSLPSAIGSPLYPARSAISPI